VDGDDTTQPSQALPLQGLPQTSSGQTPSTGGVSQTDRIAIALRNEYRHANSKFQYAIQTYNPARLHDLLTGPDRPLINVNMLFFDCTTILSLANSTSESHRDRVMQMAEELLQHPKVDVNFQQPETLYTALHMATFLNIARLCRLLLLHGADPDLKDATGTTVLKEAIYYKCDDIVVAIREHQKTRVARAVPAPPQDMLQEEAQEREDLSATTKNLTLRDIW